jgi:hypothetical protein
VSDDAARSRAYRRRKAQLQELRLQIRSAQQQFDPRWAREMVRSREVHQLLTKLVELAKEEA